MKIRKITRRNIESLLVLCGEFEEEHRLLKKNDTPFSIPRFLKKKKKILEKDLSSNKGAAFGIEHDGVLIGYIFVLSSFPMQRNSGENPAYISDLYVRKKFRRIGLASRLINEAKVWAKKKGKKGISLRVFASNKRAVNLYRKLKFKKNIFHMEGKL